MNPKVLLLIVGVAAVLLIVIVILLRKAISYGRRLNKLRRPESPFPWKNPDIMSGARAVILDWYVGRKYACVKVDSDRGHRGTIRYALIEDSAGERLKLRCPYTDIVEGSEIWLIPKKEELESSGFWVSPADNFLEIRRTPAPVQTQPVCRFGPYAKTT